MLTNDDIRRHAEHARRCGLTPNEGCHLPFQTREGLHWYACYLCSGMVFVI